MAIRKLKPAPDLASIPEGFSVLPSPLLFWQKDENLLWANPYFENIFGALSETAFQNEAPIHLIHERPATRALFSMLGRHEGLVMKNKSGKKIPVEIKVSSYGEPAAHLYIVLIEDVSLKVDLEKQLIENHLALQKAYSELKTAQDALLQSAKLASLGELSSGIAHELNQPLQAIMGFSQELTHIETLSDTGKEFLHDIVSASKKMAEIIKSLRTFARQAGDEMIETDLEHAITEAARLMHHQLMGMDIELSIKKVGPLPLVFANPIQLEQVFINFFSNARDAIEQSQRKYGKISVDLIGSTDSVVVKIKDNGSGMSTETQARIFDPFFTTKPVGKGTGLGMSISYGILKKVQARIDLKSTLGEGTEFTLTFPASQHLYSTNSKKTGENK